MVTISNQVTTLVHGISLARTLYYFGGGLRGQGGVRTDMIGARRAKGRAEAVKLPDAA
jgi:hypothetical protein